MVSTTLALYVADARDTFAHLCWGSEVEMAGYDRTEMVRKYEARTTLRGESGCSADVPQGNAETQGYLRRKYPQ